MKSMLPLMLAGSLLSGCAGRYVPLYVSPEPVADATIPVRIAATLNRLHARGEAFAATYGKASREADLVEIPLIGAAVATGLIAVNKPKSGPDTVAKIAIGAGAYTAGRSLAMPANGPDAFRRGVDSINCVLVEGYAFVGAEVDARVDALRRRTRELDIEIGLLAAAVAEDVATNKAETMPLELARANARLAIARAQEVSKAARAQLGAYSNAPGVFEQATATIVSTLAAKSWVHITIDVSELAKKWTEPPAAEGAGGSQGLRGSAAALIIRLDESRKKLDGIAAAVAAANEFDFVNRLTAVVKCPLLI